MFKVGIIGCGGRGRGHANGYSASADAKIVACADPKKENAIELAKNHKIPASGVYADHKEMLAKEKLDIVSVCVWTGLHYQVIMDTIKAGVKVIHAEKPMAPTWGESKKIFQACVDNDVVITSAINADSARHLSKRNNSQMMARSVSFIGLRDIAQICLIGELTGLICSTFIIMMSLPNGLWDR